MAALAGLAAAPVRADEAAAGAPCLAADGPAATVTGHDGYASLTLEDGREVRLADIVPAAALARSGTGADPLAALLGREATVMRAMETSGAPVDRYGRTVGDIVLKDTGDSLLGRVIAEGLALVDPAVMSDRCLDELFVAERQAEAARRGLWANGGPELASDAPDLLAAVGRYVLVEGRVESVGETRRTIYLNFGKEYRTDFTALVRRRDAATWADSLKALEGRTVRLRGVLEAWNGGLIRLEHRRQVELPQREPPG